MKLFICDLTRSTVGQFYVGPDQKLHCIGTALRTDAAAVNALGKIPPPADAVDLSADVVAKCARSIQAQTTGMRLTNASGRIDGTVETGEHISASDAANAIEIVWHAMAPAAPAAAPTKKSGQEDVLDVSASATFERRG